jgi:hypothetical protein
VSDKWHDLMTDFFDGSPTEEESLRLNEWLKSDPRNVRRFVREAIVHSHLHDLLNGEEAIRPAADERSALTSGDTLVLPAVSADDQSDEMQVVLLPPPVITRREEHTRPVRRGWFWAASILIALLAGLIVHRLTPRSQPFAIVPPEPLQVGPEEPAGLPPPPSFAAVASSVNAQWSGAPTQLLSGQQLPVTPLFLQSGVAEIKFDTGAAMIVEAPARFQVRASNCVELTSGRVSAKVPPDAHGFAVETATTRIVDLGTEFGVAISPDGSDQIDVFKGNVVASGQQAGGSVVPLLLSEGQAAISKGHELKLDPAGARPQAFVRSLNIPASIDMVDLICGGDGTTHLRNGAIDQRTGESGQLPLSSGPGAIAPDYHRVPKLQVVDGCFVPNGKEIIDSARHTFDFGATNTRTLYQIHAGGIFPAWPNPGETFTAVLGGVDYSKPGHGLILFHPNNGITFDLNAIRRIHPSLKLSNFHAVVGNTCPGATPTTNAQVLVLVDGQSRSDLPKLTHDDGAVNLRVPLTDADRFLTIALVDHRKTVIYNWIILGDPQLE